MKFIPLATIIGLLFLCPKGFGQQQTTLVKDSITIFYDQLFEKLEANYLYTKKVNWEKIRPYIKAEALKSTSFQESLKVCPVLFDTIKGDHTLLFSEKEMFQSTLKKQLTGKQFTQSLADKYESNAPFEVKVLDNHYGYVFIPGMLLLNATQEELDAKSQEIYDAILNVYTNNEIKGWIIDLRVNIGGNANVMLAGLYHLIGNNTVYLGFDPDKNVKHRTGFYNGVLYENHEVLTKVKINSEADTTIPVAILTGILTASAGEFVAFGLRRRKNSIVIGEESYGLTTANDLFELPFDTKAAITLSYGTDPTANYTASIKPDIEIIKEANFEELSKDKNIIEAIKFIDSRQSFR